MPKISDAKNAREQALGNETGSAANARLGRVLVRCLLDDCSGSVGRGVTAK
jgi:hypothetical protein